MLLGRIIFSDNIICESHHKKIQFIEKSLRLYGRKTKIFESFKIINVKLINQGG